MSLHKDEGKFSRYFRAIAPRGTVYKVYDIRPNTDPWGNPIDSFPGDDSAPLITTGCLYPLA